MQPNKPVMPFATPSKKATFIDPTVSIKNGNTVVIGFKNFIGPYVNLDGRRRRDQDRQHAPTSSTTRRSSPTPVCRHQTPEVLIGDQVVIGFGAKVDGPERDRRLTDSASKPTSIGANALIDGATIEPGAIVSPLARVGPGVTVPPGFRVLPGANVTTDAEASNPTLGHGRAGDVVRRRDDQVDAFGKRVAGGRLRHALPGQLGHRCESGRQPDLSAGSTTATWPRFVGPTCNPARRRLRSSRPRAGPEFLSPRQGLVGVQLSQFPGPDHRQESIIDMRAWQAAHHLGRANAIRADQGQPITIGSIAKTGRHVTINSPLGGTLTIGQNLRTGLERGDPQRPGVNAKIGDNVKIESGAVVVQTSIGSQLNRRPRSLPGQFDLPRQHASFPPRRFTSTTSSRDTCSGDDGPLLGWPRNMLPRVEPRRPTPELATASDDSLAGCSEFLESGGFVGKISKILSKLLTLKASMITGRRQQSRICPFTS